VRAVPPTSMVHGEFCVLQEVVVGVAVQPSEGMGSLDGGSELIPAVPLSPEPPVPALPLVDGPPLVPGPRPLVPLVPLPAAAARPALPPVE
jgi:hypothetical protein